MQGLCENLLDSMVWSVRQGDTDALFKSVSTRFYAFSSALLPDNWLLNNLKLEMNNWISEYLVS